ncbi:hypothetical protein [Nocardia pseudobrasiliensis]|uniref:Uncharacterized protein n=1 Tax=Nocardia pseudobrasiliensis TaxID=45979 RepID=A0A370I2I2_9NOCA|nr:hypothetical protein [Nocardia pseudobrasiliensis]RDI64916.1 hypothetical protein DFR76_107294 [Nocardia pseudobrasiliensis]
MDRRWPTRLFEFDGGVLEVYDYGDDPDDGPGVYLELYARAELAERLSDEPDAVAS